MTSDTNQFFTPLFAYFSASASFGYPVAFFIYSAGSFLGSSVFSANSARHFVLYNNDRDFNPVFFQLLPKYIRTK